MQGRQGDRCLEDSDTDAMKHFEIGPGKPEFPPVSGVGGFIFRMMRLLFLLCFVIIGFIGPGLVLAAGIVDGSSARIVFGLLALILFNGLGAMIFAGQFRLRRWMRHLAEETGLTLSETPDLVPGLSHLSLAGKVNGRWITVAFELLPLAGTTEYLAGGGKWHVSRKRRYLVVSTLITRGGDENCGQWVDTASPFGAAGTGGIFKDEDLARLKEKGCVRVFAGGASLAMALDMAISDHGCGEVGGGIALLNEFAAKLDSKAACPVCAAAISHNPRYPRAVCDACALRACDAEGRALDFFNAGFGGGYLAVFRDGGEPYESHDCFIAGLPCRADEARFGGIVVQVI